jgi:RHS repeat-associated protein
MRNPGRPGNGTCTVFPNAVATGNSTYNLCFSYDRYGNMSCVTNGQTNGPCPNWTFDASTNRVSTGGWNYDAAGDVTSDAIHGDAWDAEGRMSAVDNGGQSPPCQSYAAACLTYNALGQRVEALLPSAGNWRYEYLYDPWGREHGSYWDGQGQAPGWMERNIDLGQRQIANYYGGYTRMLHANALGSTLQVTYGTGANAQDQLYYPWGQQWRQAGVGEDSHFAGFEQHEYLDFYPTLFRRYNSTHGRWLSPDPLGGDITDPQSLNRYAYVLNNPTNFVDPLGLRKPKDEPLPGAAAYLGAMGGYGGCTMDGVDTPCSVVSAALQSGAAVACPGNDCTGLRATQGPGGSTVWQQWVPPGQETTTLKDPDTGDIIGTYPGSYLPGHWEVVGRVPDFWQFSINVGPWWGGTLQVSIDRYEHVYAAPGVNVGRSPGGGSVAVSYGWMTPWNELPTSPTPPTPEELRSFLTKGGCSAGAASGGGLFFNWSSGGQAWTPAVGTPQVGISCGYGFKVW